MLQQKGDAVLASVTVTQSLRARNPNVKVANSIYGEGASAGSVFAIDTASIAAPSELEFDFDDMVINSLAYRRAMAHAQTKARPPVTQEEPALGDLIDLTDNLTITEGDASPRPLLPTALQELEGLTMDASPVRKTTAEGSTSKQTPETVSAAGMTSETALVVAERKEGPGTSLARQARSTTLTTPTTLLRLGPKSEAFVRCGQCSEVLLTAAVVHVQFPNGQKPQWFHAQCFHATHSCAVRSRIPCKAYQLPLN